jgi:2-methylcitrate dehydratase PrpD
VSTVTDPTATRTASQRIAEFASSLEFRDLPADVVEKTKVVLLHNLAVALAGDRLGEVAVRFAVDYGRAESGPGARVLVGGERLELRSAAFANGLLMTVRAQDDVYLPALAHIGTIVIPAALAIAEDVGASGEDLITALVAGYETASAVGAGFASKAAVRGFRPVLWSQIGAATACSKLLGASAEEHVSSIALAASFGTGTSQTWVAGTPEWLYQSAVGCQNGLTAALLAHRGVMGAPDSMDGRLGVYAAFCGDVEGAGDVGAGLGRDWRIRETTFKPYPVCTLNQVPVTALIALAEERGIRAEDVTHVELTLNGNEARYPGIDVKGPFVDAPGALMSAQYTLAVALRERTVRNEHLLAFDDAELMDLVQRVDVKIDDALTPRSCRITVETADGTTHSTQRTSTSDTFNWDREEAIRMARSLQPETRLDGEQLDELVKTILDLERATARDLVDRCAVA